MKFAPGSDSTVSVRVKTFDGEKTYKVSCRRFVDNIIPYGDDALVGEALAEVE